MRKIFEILLICFISTLYAQNKNHVNNINVCSIKFNDSLNYYVAEEKIFKNKLSLYIKTHNTIIDKECKFSHKEYIKRLDKSNPLLLINGDTVTIKDKIESIETSIPQRIWYQKEGSFLFIAIELSNISYSTVGSGYSYIIMKFFKGILKKSLIKETKHPLKNVVFNNFKRLNFRHSRSFIAF